MISNKNFKEMLHREQIELFEKAQRDFWRTLFWSLLKEHTFQTDFFLVNQDLDYGEVTLYLQSLIQKICQKYGLRFFVNNNPYRTEIKLRIHNCGVSKTLYDELTIVITQKEIIFKMLPHSPLLNMYNLADYQRVGTVIESLCKKLFEEKPQDFVVYLEALKNIKESIKNLTPKAIEIAQNSIKAIYMTTDEKFKTITQKNIYSSMFYKGKTISVFHKDFMKNPSVLISQLK